MAINPTSNAPKTGSPLLDATGNEIQQQVAETAQSAGDHLVETIRRQPITSALVIFGIGYILGKIT